MLDAKFPRGFEVPGQSPLYWVNHKDRYLRQLLIADIEKITQRELLVYFSDCDRTPAQIDQVDDVFLSELLSARKTDKVDLLLETNGGFTDATEKFCSVLKNAGIDLRVIVPRRAKSNGTVIAFCGNEILMGRESELGPIDPSVQGVPADFVIKANQQLNNPLLVLAAITAVEQTRKLAKQLLQEGMLNSKSELEIDEILNKLATRDTYHSHGSIIDWREAKSLGLTINNLDSDSELWRKIWLLRTMYSYDCHQMRYSKIFESTNISSPVSLA
jgi:ATP-dependent protease ClpP protease subunit